MLTYSNKDVHSAIGMTPNRARKEEHEYSSRKEKKYILRYKSGIRPR